MMKKNSQNRFISDTELTSGINHPFILENSKLVESPRQEQLTAYQRDLLNQLAIKIQLLQDIMPNDLEE